MKIVLSVALSLICTQYAFASNPIQKFLDENPTKSPREVLAKTYDEAVDLMDLEYVHKPEYHCVLSDKEFDILHNVYLTRFTTIKPEIPGNGPLFPGTPAVYKNGIRLFDYLDGTLPSKETMDQYFSNVEVNLSSKQIDTTWNTSFSNGSVVTREILSVRRNRGLLTFSSAIDWTFKPATNEYGYCW